MGAGGALASVARGRQVVSRRASPVPGLSVEIWAPALPFARRLNYWSAMDQSPLTPTNCIFVLRLRQEWVEGESDWRGWIEHVPSGERAAVQDWEGVMAFVRRFGVGVESGRVEVGGRIE